jgi:hypothetical protein
MTDLVWTSYGGGVYTTTHQYAIGVYDSKVLDEYNNAKKYEKKTTILDVQSTAGTWCKDGTTLYVHTLDGAKPLNDSDIKVLWSGGITLNPNATNTYYFEGITFEFNDTPALFVNAGTLLFKNCKFRNGVNSMGLQVTGANLVILQASLEASTS